MSIIDVSAKSTADTLPDITGEIKTWRFWRRFRRYLVRIGPLALAQGVLIGLDGLGKGMGFAHVGAGAVKSYAILGLTSHYFFIVPLAHKVNPLAFFIIVYLRQMSGKPLGFLLASRNIEECARAMREKAAEKRGWITRWILRVESGQGRCGRAIAWIFLVWSSTCPPLNPFGFFGPLGSPLTWAGTLKLKFVQVMRVTAFTTLVYVCLMYFFSAQFEMVITPVSHFFHQVISVVVFGLSFGAMAVVHLF